jgi:hypothetical protein
VKPNPLTKWIINRKVAHAIRAVENGTASDTQQKFFLRWLVQMACQTYDDPFQPGKADLTNYYLGRQSIGKLVVMHLRAKLKEDGP